MSVQRKVPDNIKLPVRAYDPEKDDSIPGTEQEIEVSFNDNGVHLLLGADFKTAHDVYLERQAGVWKLWVHPAGGDPVCIMTIGDAPEDGYMHVVVNVSPRSAATSPEWRRARWMPWPPDSTLE